MRVGLMLPTDAGADWQQELARAVRDPAELCRILDLPRELSDPVVGDGLPLLVPRSFLRRIRRGDPEDPLLLQVLPRKAELQESAGYSRDPVGEAEQGAATGLLWKYTGRILILTTGVCSVHCRFCFRRHFPFSQSGHSEQSEESCPLLEGKFSTPLKMKNLWNLPLEIIATEPSIHEVILSGGDPLVLLDSQLDFLVKNLSKISHLRRIRIHSRLPVMIPCRVTEELIRVLRGGRPTPVMVVHVNHPAEIDAEVAVALTRLIEGGIPTLSQSVLLKGINDRGEVLVDLYERLVDLRVMPYYLHQLDPVAGAAHFEVPIENGRRLIRQLRARLPGYAVPRYVRETRGGKSKEILA
jgi:EF-P beta-lysylation protein EpmB